MLVGHLAVGLIGKRAAPAVSLGSLMLAALCADLLWCILLIAGIERAQIISPGKTLMTSMAIFEISYSHSLLSGAILGALFAAVYWWRRHDTFGAWVLCAAIVSHWVLDVISHNPDMAWMPGGRTRLGLGLWNSIPATLLVEGLFWLAALFVYVRATRSRNRVTTFAFWAAVIFLTAAWWNNIAGPPPSNLAAMAYSSFGFFLAIVAWAYWLNRSRDCADPALRAAHLTDSA